MTILIFIVSLLGAIAIGVPIAWALLLCGISLMFWMDIFDVQILAQTLVNGADSFSLLAIPFFVLAGEIMNAGGLSQRIVDLPMKLVGHRPGGLGYVGVLAAMIMASLSGSAVADTAAVAALLVPMMRQANYPVNRAAGLIGSGGIIAAIIPPSIPLIIFGVSSGLSISKLFMAGARHHDGRHADGYLVVAGKTTEFTLSAESLTARSLAILSFRYLGALFTDNYYWRFPFGVIYTDRSRRGCRLLRSVRLGGGLSRDDLLHALSCAD